MADHHGSAEYTMTADKLAPYLWSLYRDADDTAPEWDEVPRGEQQGWIADASHILMEIVS